MPFASTEIVIDAPIDLVWQVMTDVHQYSEWNPFIEKIGCAVDKAAVGTDLTLHVHFNTGMKVATVERITRLEAPAKQSDGVTRATLEYQFLGPLHALYLVRGKRPQVIEQLADGKTRYRTEERLYGLLAFASPIKAVQDGFERHSAALKQRCESLHKTR